MSSWEVEELGGQRSAVGNGLLLTMLESAASGWTRVA